MVELGICYKDLPNKSLSMVDLKPPCSLNFRPRGSLARALYKKHQTDEYLSQFDKTQWYLCDLRNLPADLTTKFIQLGPDEDTITFLQQAEEKSDWIPTQIWHSIAKAFLGWFMSQTCINGWLQRGSMFVVSLPQFLKLLRVNDEWQADSLLDLGAGDGQVTAHLAKPFKRICVTELSATMRGLLQKRSYELLDIDSWHQQSKFDVISCLNLIDRCDSPLEMLQQIKTALKPNGLVLLGVVLPFSAYVESGSADHKPKQLLPINGTCFEEQVRSVVVDVLKPMGFEVVSWSRVPYLCEGDLQQSYYWLDDAIFVLKINNNITVEDGDIVIGKTHFRILNS